jgi:hypothetical protein
MMLCCGAALAAEDANIKPSIRVSTVAVSPQIDGRLDDACWSDAPAAQNFLQVVPIEGADPSERTEIRVVRDTTYLYVAVRCFDREPKAILAPTLRRDTDFEADDVVRIGFDTFRRGRDGYVFSVNPAGARTDAVFVRFGETNRDWDALWVARARIDELGWTAEIALPVSSLAFDPDADAWGFNCERVIRRKQETVRWTGIMRTKKITSIEDYGSLEGLSGFRQGLGLEWAPYVKYARGSGPRSPKPGSHWDAGFDLTWRITPSLAAVGTVLPDFAEAEVDTRVVNLTRFPVYFPEKRDFFLEDISLFDFGGLPPTSAPYYSRRIGLGRNRQPLDILGAARVTGRVDRTTVAFLGARQDAQPGAPAHSLGVLRVAQQVNENANMGLIATAGDPRNGRDAWLGGLDGGFLFDRFGIGHRVLGNLFLMQSDTTLSDQKGEAWGLELEYPNEPVRVHFFVRDWGDGFDPALGFVDRVGIREYMLAAEYLWRVNSRLLRTTSLEINPRVEVDDGNRVVTGEHNLPALSFETPSGDEAEFEYTRYREVLDEPFQVWPGVNLQPGTYEYWQFKPWVETSKARPLSASVQMRFGEFYDGDVTGWKPGLSWRPSGHFNISANWEERTVRLPAGEFVVRITSSRIDLAFTPDLTWTNLVEYDNRSRLLGVNSRIRWSYRPGHDVFLVLNNGWLDQADRYSRQFGDFTAKVQTAWRF